jgi:predicted MFS family arabinose efflux permease
MTAETAPTAVASATDATGRNVVILGWVSFWGGLSQDMILPILPAFLASALGLSKASIGLIEGTLSTVVRLLKLLSGVIADRTQRRKALVLTGYALSAARPALAPVGSGGAALGLRALDGAGKRLKDAPPTARPA